MKYNVLTGVDSWYYSFEYYGESSLWNYLFPGKNFKGSVEDDINKKSA